MKILKQSTQVDVLIGPLIDDGDFKSVEESVAYNAAGIDVDVVKGVTKADVTLANSSGDGYWRHVANGYYALTLSTTDTATLGHLRVTFEATGVLPCWEYYVVVPANVYDSLVAGSDKLYTDAVEISSSSTAADGVESNIAYLDASINGLNDPTAAAIADAVWDEAISGHTGSGSTGEALSGASAPSAATVADAVWDEARSGHTSAGTFGAGVLAESLNTQAKADVNAEADSALSDYDPPTKTEMDNAFAALNDLSAADVNAEVDTALADYDAPTKTEMDAGFAALNDLSAEDVWTYATRTLTSFGTLVADIWEYSTRTITNWGSLIAYIWSYTTRTLTSFGTLVDDVETELSTNHGAGSWEGTGSAPTVEQIDTQLTSSHGSGSWAASAGTTPADIWTYQTRTLTSFGTLIADIWEYSTRTLTGFGTLIADIWDYAARTLTGFGTLAADVDTQLSGTHGAGSWEGAAAAPTVEQIDARLSNTHGSGSWQGEGAGEIWGDIEVRYKLTEPPEGSGTPIADALVWVTTDEAGTNIVQSRRTNDFGYVKTPFYLDAGRYYFWRSKAGINFVNPDVEDVS